MYAQTPCTGEHTSTYTHPSKKKREILFWLKVLEGSTHSCCLGPWGRQCTMVGAKQLILCLEDKRKENEGHREPLASSFSSQMMQPTL